MPGGQSGRRVTWRRVLGVTLATVVWALATGAVLGASPSPAAGGDPRSSGQGPGLVGDPAFAVLAVVAIGIGALAITLAYVRLTGGRRA
jgi:hypothetical protein